MERDQIYNGVVIGKKTADLDTLIDDIRHRCIDCGCNFVSIGFNGPAFDQSYFVEWAKFLADNRITFCFSKLSQHTTEGVESRILPETVAKVKEVAGEYFLGERINEAGSVYACKLPGYYMNPATDVHGICAQPDNFDSTQYRNMDLKYYLEQYDDMEQAHKEYVKTFSKFTAIPHNYKMPEVLCVEATFFARYNAEAGITIPMLEVYPGNPDSSISNVRGTARAVDSRLWGTYIAHGWYGGLRLSDPLKMKRLELTYKYAYLAGSQIIQLENGDNGLNFYGQTLDKNSPVCQNYRRVVKEMSAFIKEDFRPKGGPKVKVAFVSGLHDAWAGRWGRSCLWNQFYREEWAYNAPEHSWLMLEELQTKRAWTDVANYGEYDASGAPGYGLYDIVPIEADVDKLSRYDWLIFLGWNTMTEETMDKLTEYVRRGGHLVMSAAHLNTQTKRNGEYKMVSIRKVEALFGCRFMGEIRRTVNSAKFKYESLDERVMYPVYNKGASDPLFTAGYANYARFATLSGKTIAYASDAFFEKDYDLPMVIENRVGKGVATLLTHTCYPGDPAVYQLYRAVVREIISASARSCDIRVIGSDRVRYSVYEGGKLYLLNTDYDMPVTVKVIAGDKEQTVTLDSLELKTLQI